MTNVSAFRPATDTSGVLPRPAPSTVAASGPGNPELGSLAFGHVEFDWGPAAAGGVPGFDSWPPGSRR